MGLWAWLRRLLASPTSDRPDTRPDGPPIAFVLLLRQPRDLDADELAQIASAAFDEPISADPDATDRFIAGSEPSFVLKLGERFFLINVFPRPYMDDRETAARSVGELRLRKAVREHEAWLSVDLLGDCTERDLPAVYRVIGKLTAALADDDCLAIYAPATGQLNAFDEDVVRQLRGDRPLALFESPTHPPVVPVSGDDPRLRAAVTKARRRWDEFVSAFEERRPDQTFSVKARIGDEETSEFMWVSVTGLENGWIYGRLDNDPVELTHIRCGDRVRVAVKELNDWLYTDGERMAGGFTIEVLRKIQEEM